MTKVLFRKHRIKFVQNLKILDKVYSEYGVTGTSWRKRVHIIVPCRGDCLGRHGNSVSTVSSAKNEVWAHIMWPGLWGWEADRLKCGVNVRCVLVCPTARYTYGRLSRLWKMAHMAHRVDECGGGGVDGGCQQIPRFQLTFRQYLLQDRQLPARNRMPLKPTSMIGREKPYHWPAISNSQG